MHVAAVCGLVGLELTWVKHRVGRHAAGHVCNVSRWIGAAVQSIWGFSAQPVTR